ncbi:MAG TPA: AAA family ATPase [Pseudonocardiaceae bacterium]|nr:AAA family ATPase [Pseudonocardiaceae bacterium]
MLTTLAVANYRSLRDLVVPLGRLTLVTGANGTGKSSLYRALRLLADASRNGAVAALAREGGLPSTLWAGPERPVRDGRPAQGTRRTHPVALRLGFSGDEFGYALDFGLPVPNCSMFDLDPEIKRECLWTGPVLRPAALMVDRAAGTVRVRDDQGRWSTSHHSIGLTDSVFSELAEPELMLVRERIRSWRFYDQFRTDADAPARRRQVGTRTPVLDHEGADLAAAIQTIIEIGDQEALNDAVANAFPGSRVRVADQGGWFDLLLHQQGLLRPLGTAELSDGTLRYLLLVAALLTPRPPELLVLNEPETSLHPDLLAPLASLVATAATRTQLVVVSHATPLMRAMAATADELDVPTSMVELVKQGGATGVDGQGPLDGPSWRWPTR